MLAAIWALALAGAGMSICIAVAGYLFLAIPFLILLAPDDYSWPHAIRGFRFYLVSCGLMTVGGVIEAVALWSFARAATRSGNPQGCEGE